MNTNTIIEAIGYLGSALVLVSFLMASVVKLRVVNTIGSVIFTTYAFIIHSYPTAIMNVCLVLINIYYLVKMSNTKVDYSIVRVNSKDALVGYLLRYYSADIQNCFPENLMDFSESNIGYVVCHNGKPVSLFFGKEKDGTVDIELDYSIPEYRDFSIGKYLVEKFPEEGIKKLIYRGPDKNHKTYLMKMGYKKNGNYYVKNL
ncbi:inner membrane protein [Butyrivibrio proteoclasticus]|uniref:Inner membrane protein n=1 Tax=Butyrivibrio proteoclasticus TaxID=43305 RepID=A0A1I5S2I5_9FIRM|nr:YgjV family protein [Butyrivibrio proteoclasticus]SFP64867.1 inner membrane protein [Butyrivibrio proteoclasticus]